MRRILLAEDQPDSRKLTRIQLESAGYLIDGADNGETATEMAAAFQYDAILMDLQMPGMDGLTAARAIREDEQRREQWRKPIVALTAHALPRFRDESRAAGMDGFLMKPVPREDLLRTLDAVIDPRPVVLTVDDDLLFLRLASAFLGSNERRRVLTATSSAMAKQLFAAHNVSLVLLDLELGKDSGLDLAEDLLAMARLSVPIVAMTAHDEAEYRQRATQAGCTEFLAKPFGPDQLAEIAERYAPARGAQTETSGSGLSDEDRRNFLASVRERTDTMTRLVTQGRLGEIAAIAHTLAGAGAGYGLPDVTTAGRHIEDAVSGSDVNGVVTGIRRLAECLKQGENHILFESVTTGRRV